VAKPNFEKKDRHSPLAAYDLALGSYQSGLHEQARERFAAFLKRWPGHALAPNALYWSGETWYARGRYDLAAKFFAQVVRDYPRHAKSPDALLKLAYSAMRQGRLKQAGSYLRDLEARYPTSPASRLGRQARIRLQGQNGAARVVFVHG
jgi:tol-pal system protein YbgF